MTGHGLELVAEQVFDPGHRGLHGVQQRDQHVVHEFQGVIDGRLKCGEEGPHRGLGERVEVGEVRV